jgi:hypothetical protein
MSILAGCVMIVLSIVLALAGLFLVRRTVPLAFLETHHEVAGFFIGVLGVIYAVLLAFVVIVVWEDFRDANSVVTQEANQLGDIVYLSRGLQAPVWRQVRAAAIHYAQVVYDDEWQAMRRDEASQQAQAAMAKLWQLFLEMEVPTARESVLYTEILHRLGELSDSRRERLHASQESIPTVIWVVLWTGGLITIVFTYFFGVRSIRSQALMTAALTGEIALTLFLITMLDHPFRGDVAVGPGAFQEIVERMQQFPADER